MVQFDRISRTQNFERLDPEITFLIQRHSNKIPPNPQDRTGDNRQLYQIDGEVISITDDEFYAFLKQQEVKLSNTGKKFWHYSKNILNTE